MNENLEKLAGINFEKPTIKLKHADLERWGSDSIHKSKCPVCSEGILLMRRNIKTFNLENTDRCVLCGQHFEYIDIPDNTIEYL